MILGKVRCGFFQEQVFLFKLASTSPQLRQLRSFGDGQRRLLAGVLSPIGINPVPERPLDNAELLSDLSNRTRRLDHQLHSLFTKLRRLALL